MEMNPSQRERLVETYLAHADAVSHDRADPEGYWSAAAIDDMIRGDVESAWPLVRELLRKAADDRMLAFIAAGPLEDLISLHGWALMERVAEAARSDQKLRRALTGIWVDELPEELLRRLRLLVEGEPPL